MKGFHFQKRPIIDRCNYCSLSRNVTLCGFVYFGCVLVMPFLPRLWAKIEMALFQNFLSLLESYTRSDVFEDLVTNAGDCAHFGVHTSWCYQVSRVDLRKPLKSFSVAGSHD